MPSSMFMHLHFNIAANFVPSTGSHSINLRIPKSYIANSLSFANFVFYNDIETKHCYILNYLHRHLAIAFVSSFVGYVFNIASFMKIQSCSPTILHSSKDLADHAKYSVAKSAWSSI